MQRHHLPSWLLRLVGRICSVLHPARAGMPTPCTRQAPHLVRHYRALLLCADLGGLYALLVCRPHGAQVRSADAGPGPCTGTGTCMLGCCRSPLSFFAGAIYTRFAAYVRSPEAFDGAVFGLSGAEAAGLDPQARLLLEASFEASACHLKLHTRQPLS